MQLEPRTWLVLGAGGMLGKDMVRVARDGGHRVIPADRHHTDITDPSALASALEGVDIVVNCAAYTAVDAAETDEEQASLINAVAPELIARACKDSHARLVHVSTDYVFAGDATEPYTEDCKRAPISAYGRTKADGEERVEASGADALIVRTAWLYGENGPCFPKTIARLASERGELSVVDDQHGQPTWTRDLADFILRLVDASVPAGIYHGTSSGTTTWYEFASRIIKSAVKGVNLLPVSSDAYPRPAPRPGYSVLAHNNAEANGVEPISDWEDRWLAASHEVLKDV